MIQIPNAEKIYPGEKCEICGHELEPIDEAGDELDTVYIGCPNGAGHTEHNGQPRELLKMWGWKI